MLLAEEEGFEPSVQFPIRHISNVLVSATHPLRRGDIPDLNGVLSPESEFYSISGIWQVVMGVNSFLQPDLDRYSPRPPASI